MGTRKDKPKGYFDYLPAIDCETTGLCFSNDNPVYNPKTGERHQTVSWGFIVADALTLKPIEKLYVEIAWNENSLQQRLDDPRFGKKAESIHGLTMKHLFKNGLTEEDAVCKIGELILKYWGPNVSIRTLGHNVHMFDLRFLMDLFQRQEIILKFGNRHYDTNSMGFCAMTTWTSDELFSNMGFDDRGDHNALDDAEMALESARRLRLIFGSVL